jgi:hypothetical protein
MNHTFDIFTLEENVDRIVRIVAGGFSLSIQLRISLAWHQLRVRRTEDCILRNPIVAIFHEGSHISFHRNSDRRLARRA